MGILRTALFGLSLLSVSAWSEVPCEAPQPPNVSLDIERATSRDFKELYLAVKAYQRDAAAYRECLDVNVPAKQMRRQLYNESVDAEQALAEAFNASFVAFREKMQERSR